MAKRVMLTPSQEKAYNTIMAGFNVCLTGNAGTGKSFLLNKIISDFSAMGRNVIVAAPTGIAAINVGGTTLHKLLWLKPDIYVGKTAKVTPPFMVQDPILIIDEISMCRIDLFEYIGRVLQKTHKNIQVIVCGDFFQLPPVMPRAKNGGINEKDILDNFFGFDVGGGYAFLAPQWDRLNFKTMVLTEVIRQDDPRFIAALDYARRGDVRSIRYFREESSPHEHEKGIYLAGRNAEVDEINAQRLAEIDSRPSVYEAIIEGEVSNQDMTIAPRVNELKVGARVMTLVNSEDGSYFNGSMGYITELLADSVVVEIDNSNEVVEIGRHTWEIVKYDVNTHEDGSKELKRNVCGKIKQIPVKLAYAVTIHKSQGQTFDFANLNPHCWDAGQLYVALSRVRSIEGLYLTSPIKNFFLKADPAVQEFYKNAGVNEPEDAGIAREFASPSRKRIAQAASNEYQFSLFS